MKSILAIVIAASLMLASSVVVAEEQKSNMAYISYVTADGTLVDTYELSEEKINKIENLMNSVEKYLQSNLTNQTKIILSLLVGIAIGIIIGVIITKAKYKVSPLAFLKDLTQKRVFIFSSGYTKRLLPKLVPKLKIHKRHITWMYNTRPWFSKTIILDLLPPKVKVLKGSQIGTMKKFTGFYIQIPKLLRNEVHTIFFGYAKKVTSIDIPEIYS